MIVDTVIDVALCTLATATAVGVLLVARIVGFGKDVAR